LRLEALLKQYSSTLTDTEFRALKHDVQLPPDSPSLSLLAAIQQFDEQQYPYVADLIR